MKQSYWMKYNALLHKFSALPLYRMVLRFVRKLGDPYPLHHLGRKPKVSPCEYAAYIAYMLLVKGSTYRQMESESELYLGKHIDHATFVVNLEKISCEYFLDLVEETGEYLSHILSYSKDYIIDSTAVSTPLTFITVIKNKEVKEHVEFRGHALASYHPQEQSICIHKALATTKRIADCEGAKRMLEQGTIKNITLHADRGYDYERVYKACEEQNITPNIRPQAYKGKKDNYRTLGLIHYDDELRKQKRGVVETIFGGITNAGLMITRLKKDTKIKAYTAIILLRQNIMTIARNLATVIEFLTKLGEVPYGVPRRAFACKCPSAACVVAGSLFIFKNFL